MSAICRLVEQYTITVVRGITEKTETGREVECLILVPDSEMADVYNQRMVMERVVEAMQLLLQKQFPAVLGFQGLTSPIVANLNQKFLAGETIFQAFHAGYRHFVLCFAERGFLYYFCSLNRRPSAVVKERMGRIFCALGQPAIEVQVVAVEEQSAAECGLRVATAGALLCSGKAIDLVSRVKYPPIETQYKDFEHCLVESQWLPRWAENLQFHEEPLRTLPTFDIKHPPKGRSILPLSLSIVYSSSYARD